MAEQCFDGEALAVQAGGPESEPQRLSKATLVHREVK